MVPAASGSPTGRVKPATINGSTWSIGVGHALGNATHAYAGYRFVEGDDIEDLSLHLFAECA